MSDPLEKLIKAAGFVDIKEFHAMVAKVNISTLERLRRFRVWSSEDGSKRGLEEVTQQNAVEETP